MLPLQATKARDVRYRERLLEPIRVCADYKPAFGVAGREAEIDLAGFTRLFGADPLYSWLGLNSPLMYAAHKAAGGMTSIYRQIGIGCERLVRSIIQDELALSDDEVRWGFEVKYDNGGETKSRRLTLDARIDREHVGHKVARSRLDDWLQKAGKFVGNPQGQIFKGTVFEVRQGYKSADSKRQNADLTFGLRAYGESYLPVVFVVSNQVSQTVIERYRNARLLVLTGRVSSDPLRSSYAFLEQVVGYSMTAFFERNTEIIQTEVEAILSSLLSPS